MDITLKGSESYYIIADHLVKIVDFIGLDIDNVLPSFIPFKSTKLIEKPLITVEVKPKPTDLVLPERRLLSDISVIWLENFRFEESDKAYYTSILGSKDSSAWLMQSTKDFRHSLVYPQDAELYNTSKLSWLIMVAFGQACLAFKTLLLHASVVENGDSAVAFLGKSGTGKSTHSRLWIKHIAEFQLLNDDNPAIRISDGQTFIFGTPWSGKTACYRNLKLPLTGIIRLQQWKENEFKELSGIQALTALLPSGSAIRWNLDIFGSMVNVLEFVAQNVPVGSLKCLPNQVAAELSFRSIRSLNRDADQTI